MKHITIKQEYNNPYDPNEDLGYSVRIYFYGRNKLNEANQTKLRLIENEILRTRFEEGISINRAIVERLKREGKEYYFMEASVQTDEQVLKEALADAKKEFDKN